jgi:hypothetical protein
MAELQLAKEVETEIKRRLKARKSKEKIQQRQLKKTYRAMPEESWSSWIERTAPAED